MLSQKIRNKVKTACPHHFYQHGTRGYSYSIMDKEKRNIISTGTEEVCFYSQITLYVENAIESTK